MIFRGAVLFGKAGGAGAGQKGGALVQLKAHRAFQPRLQHVDNLRIYVEDASADLTAQMEMPPGGGTTDVLIGKMPRPAVRQFTQNTFGNETGQKTEQRTSAALPIAEGGGNLFRRVGSVRVLPEEGKEVFAAFGMIGHGISFRISQKNESNSQMHGYYHTPAAGVCQEERQKYSGNFLFS